MRTTLIISTAALTLALSGCGPKATTTADTGTMNVATEDNMMVSPSENAMATTDTGVEASGAPAFAGKAAMSDMYEIAASTLAVANAKDPAVKKFAQDMVDAHTKTTAGLKAALAKDNVTVTPPAMLDASHQALIDALKAAKGADFDALYVSQQTDAHTQALAAMQGYAASGASRAVKAFAADTAPKVEGHLKMVKGLAAKR